MCSLPTTDYVFHVVSVADSKYGRMNREEVGLAQTSATE